MKFGVIGVRHGHINLFIQQMQEMGHEFIGMSEKDPVEAEKYSKKYNVPLMSEEELLSMSPEVIGTTSINNEKIDVIEKCDKYGVHVMADKPIVTNLNDYRRLEKVVNRGVIKVGLMLTERFEPPMYTLRKYILEGKLGKLVNYITFRPHKLVKKSRPAWHFEKEQCGSIIVDLLIHDFDMLRWFTGSEVKESSGYLINGGNPEYPRFFDSTQVIATTGNGVMASLQADWCLPTVPETWGDTRMMFVGTHGRALIRTSDETAGQNSWYACVSTYDEPYRILEAENVPHNLIEDFLMRIDGCSDVIISADDVLKSTYATLAAEQNSVVVK